MLAPPNDARAAPAGSGSGSTRYDRLGGAIASENRRSAADAQEIAEIAVPAQDEITIRLFGGELELSQVYDYERHSIYVRHENALRLIRAMLVSLGLEDAQLEEDARPKDPTAAERQRRRRARHRDKRDSNRDAERDTGRDAGRDNDRDSPPLLVAAE